MIREAIKDAVAEAGPLTEEDLREMARASKVQLATNRPTPPRVGPARHSVAGGSVRSRL